MRLYVVRFRPGLVVCLAPYSGPLEDLEYGSREYQDFIQHRTAAVLDLLTAGVSLVLIDSDHYWCGLTVRLTRGGHYCSLILICPVCAVS